MAIMRLFYLLNKALLQGGIRDFPKTRTLVPSLKHLNKRAFYKDEKYKR